MGIEGLVELFYLTAANKSIQGIKICRGAPYINHLLFADDSVVFFKADVSSNKKFWRSFISMLWPLDRRLM